MSYPNPYYDPEASRNSTYHYKQMTTKQDMLNTLNDEDHKRQLETQIQEHRIAGMACYRQQHETVAGYAGDVLPYPLALIAGSLSCAEVPTVDYEAFPTIESVEDMHARLFAYLRDSERYDRNGLPEGQPKDLDAFADRNAAGFSQSLREFSDQELESVGRFGGYGTSAIVTQDIRPDGRHISIGSCFGRSGIHVSFSTEFIIPLLLREMKFKARPPATTWSRITDALRMNLLKQDVRPIWENVFFYQHKEPEDGYPEHFIRLEPRILNGYYMTGPEVRYQSIPTVLKLTNKPMTPSM